MPSSNKKQPRFALIKAFLRDKVESQEWPVGRRIPTEQSLAEMFSVSRMTARRAVQELTDEGLFTRTAGLGTFVTEISAHPEVLTIVDVVAQAQSEGCHTHRILSIDTMEADNKTALMLQLSPKATIFEIRILHRHADRPVQWQSLSVNAQLVPALMKQKLDKIVPDAYLDWIAPPTSRQYQLKAVVPSASQGLALELAQQERPLCVQLIRKNWLGSEVISLSKMLHPATSYMLGTDIEPNDQ